MAEQIAQRLSAVTYPDNKELQFVLNSIVDDLTALRTAITGITAKLDADATVTDTDYAATHDPAALTTIK